ncbi:adenylate/guanylate cyclase domain-containing protein [Roseospira marina]|uniref:Adenylate/guanylate cyclase domain-containing protein n=1 Tax=Roseospira marina TaxID=140057 RepID=A0A5M6IC40_9PROT|nr:adenylate/guanylate cyclase domain-containing protein [Roseospira marina]KAA5605816.1 adenylate/guanylate cyclase domain-containing protein [Roseospira marina]MBB4313633.1 adenylate cyclase [Roseospira marina]MBB5086795.1 adenylate cyclase [Roseospira marina]
MVAALTLATLVLYVAGRDTRLPAELELLTLDARLRLRGPEAPSGAVVLVLADDRTLAALGGGTVSRAHLAQAVAALDALGARAIALNLLLEGAAEGVAPGAAEALRAVADRLEGIAPHEAAVMRSVLGEDGKTRALAEAITAARAPVVLPFGVVTSTSALGAPGAGTDVPGLPAHAFRVVLRASGSGAGTEADAVQAPSPALLAAADAVGHARLILDVDGALRHHDPVVSVGGRDYPSLALQAARVALGISPDDLAVSLGAWVRLGDRVVPLDRAGRIAVDPYGPAGSLPSVSLIDVLEGTVPPGVIRDRLVLVGGSASGFGARFPSPFAANLTAAEHVGTMIDNILSGRVLRRGDAAVPADVAAILLGAGLTGAAALALPYGTAALVAVALAGLWAGVTVWALTALGLWLNIVFPVGGIVAVFVPCALWRRIREQRRRRQMERQRDNLSRYVSPAMVESLANRDAPFAGDRMIDAAVLFVDMRESTRICDGLDPREAMDLLRAFLSVVERCVFDHDGVLDRFQGDGAMASFGPPEPTPDYALNALRAARCLAESVAAWSATREADGHPPIRIGVGVHCGRVLMGELGGERQFAFTLSGETVAIASRLEGMTKTEGCVILVSEDLLAAARPVASAEEPVLAAFHPLGQRTVRGRSAPLDVWAWPG